MRLWGSIAFVIGSALVGKLVSLYDYRAILALLSIGIASMLLGMLLRPSVMPQGESRHQESAGWPAWRSLVAQSWRFLACVCLLQGAHAAYYGFSAIYWQGAGYSASAVGYLWSLGVVAEVIIFALSKSCSGASARAICSCFLQSVVSYGGALWAGRRNCRG